MTPRGEWGGLQHPADRLNPVNVGVRFFSSRSSATRVKTSERAVSIEKRWQTSESHWRSATLWPRAPMPGSVRFLRWWHQDEGHDRDFMVANPFRQRIRGTPDLRRDGRRGGLQRWWVFVPVLLHQAYGVLTHFGGKSHDYSWLHSLKIWSLFKPGRFTSRLKSLIPLKKRKLPPSLSWSCMKSIEQQSWMVCGTASDSGFSLTNCFFGRIRRFSSGSQ